MAASGISARVGEEDVGGAGGAEQPRGRCVQVTQQPVPDSVVRDGVQRVVHVVQQLPGAYAFDPSRR